MSIIKHKKIFLIFSGFLVVASAVAIITFGLQPGIDFVGGTLWNVRFTEGEVPRESLEVFFRDSLSAENIVITEQSGESLLIRAPEIDEVRHADYLFALEEEFGQVEELRFETIGASIGEELRNRSRMAVILVLIAISLYTAFAFRKVSHPVSSWKYGIITLVTLFHDAIIPTGLFAVFGKLMHIEIDTNFIVAILVVMGFSVHDTIVVFDRIRENLRNARSQDRDNFDFLVGKSIKETIVRSINTSLTLIVVLVALYILGSSSLQYFILTILIGTIVGTYSSIFLASPLLTLWKKKS